jgi:hypothetical protein
LVASGLSDFEKKPYTHPHEDFWSYKFSDQLSKYLVVCFLDILRLCIALEETNKQNSKMAIPVCISIATD